MQTAIGNWILYFAIIFDMLQSFLYDKSEFRLFNFLKIGEIFIPTIWCTIGLYFKSINSLNFVLWMGLWYLAEDFDTGYDIVLRNVLFLLIPAVEQNTKILSAFWVSSGIQVVYHLGEDWGIFNRSGLYYVFSGSMHTTSFAYAAALFPNMLQVTTLLLTLILYAAPIVVVSLAVRQSAKAYIISAAFVVHVALFVRLFLVVTNVTIFAIAAASMFIPSDVFQNEIEEPLNSRSKSDVKQNQMQDTNNNQTYNLPNGIAPSKDTTQNAVNNSHEANSYTTKVASKLRYLWKKIPAVNAPTQNGAICILWACLLLDLARPFTENSHVLSWMNKHNPIQPLFNENAYSLPHTGCWLEVTGIVQVDEKVMGFNVLKEMKMDEWKPLSDSMTNAIQFRNRKSQIPSIGYALYPTWRIERWAHKLFQISHEKRQDQLASFGLRLCNFMQASTQKIFKQEGTCAVRNCKSILAGDTYIDISGFVYDILDASSPRRYSKPYAKFQQRVYCGNAQRTI